MEAVTLTSTSSLVRSSPPHGTPRSSKSRAKSAVKSSSLANGPAVTVGSNRDGVPKPKQSKSRNGCATCKRKRLKCDETKPRCQQCSRRNVVCEGYKKDFKWRAFEETTQTTKPILSPKMRNGPTCAKILAPRLGTSAASEGFCSTASMGIGFSHSTYQPPPPSVYPLPAHQLPPEPVASHIHSFHSDDFHHRSQPYLISPISIQHSCQSLSPSGSPTSVVEDRPSPRGPSTTRPTFTSGQSPRLIDLLLPGTDLRATPPEYKDYSNDQPETIYQPGGHASAQDYQKTPKAEDAEEIVRQPERAESWGLYLPSPAPSNSSTSTEGYSLNASIFMSRQPRLHSGSPEMLMMRFDQQTCGILSVKDGPTENPWRTMLWPLARESPALHHAISSLAAFHSSKEQPELRVVGMEHMRRSIRSLAEGLKTMRTEVALATTLVLVFSESWDQHISSGTKHLRGARILVNQALTRHRRQALHVKNFQRLKFLCNTWVYMDVIARLTSLDDDDSECFDAVLSHPYGPPTSYENVDPLMGCASTLFPLIGRVANLIRKVRTSSTNSINIISQANELKAALENWQVPSAFEAPEDPMSEIQHSLQTAEAYRWATLLYLHQAVPEIPFKSAAQLAEKVLVYLATVPLTSRTIIVQIYPLLAAGCEATGQEDRTWVKDRWEVMMTRMSIGNLDRGWEVIKEVWDRRDSHAAERNEARDGGWASPMPAGSGLLDSAKKKRKFPPERNSCLGYVADDEFGWAKRRVRDETMCPDAGAGPVEYLPGKKSIDLLEEMEFEKTVRGRLHWIGVMKDWKWEGRDRSFFFLIILANSAGQFSWDERTERTRRFDVGWGRLRPGGTTVMWTTEEQL